MIIEIATLPFRFLVHQTQEKVLCSIDYNVKNEIERINWAVAKERTEVEKKVSRDGLLANIHRKEMRLFLRLPVRHEIGVNVGEE